jgi:hypothetical protein
MNTNIKNVRFVEMTFDHTIAFDIQEIADANNFVTDRYRSGRVWQVGTFAYHFERW